MANGLDLFDGKTSQEIWSTTRSRIAEMIDIRYGGDISELLHRALLSPVDDVLNRPSHRFRAQLVDLGARLGGDEILSVMTEQRCAVAAHLVELLHAGSLIVDDIQDESPFRRGLPTLHRTYGVPTALNAGNWLYFWALQSIPHLQLTADQELPLYRYSHRVLARAHCGQAIDVGTRIDDLSQDRVSGVCLSSMELKSGALMALAMVLGAILNDAPESRVSLLDEFGHGFGLVLQMFNDIGNMSGARYATTRYEDLMHRRPSWIWAFAAQTSTPAEYREFVAAVRALPNDEALAAWTTAQGFMARVTEAAHEQLALVQDKLDAALEMFPCKSAVLAELRQLGEQVSRKYF
jgi:geranylgeranyl pyrophosphate synthase